MKKKPNKFNAFGTWLVFLLWCIQFANFTTCPTISNAVSLIIDWLVVVFFAWMIYKWGTPC